MCLLATIVRDLSLGDTDRVLVDSDFERKRRDCGLRLGPIVGPAFLEQLRKDVELLTVRYCVSVTSRAPTVLLTSFRLLATGWWFPGLHLVRWHSETCQGKRTCIARLRAGSTTRQSST
jgi:hypothetical protein